MRLRHLIGRVARGPTPSPMPARRLEDRIRELCARALYEKEPEWSGTIHQLQSAIQEHALRISNASMGAARPIQVERRHA